MIARASLFVLTVSAACTLDPNDKPCANDDECEGGATCDGAGACLPDPGDGQDDTTPGPDVDPAYRIVARGQEPTALAACGDWVFWTEASGALHGVPQAGGDAVTLARSGDIRELQCGGGDIFWLEGQASHRYRPGATSGPELLDHDVAHLAVWPGGTTRWWTNPRGAVFEAHSEAAPERMGQFSGQVAQLVADDNHVFGLVPGDGKTVIQGFSLQSRARFVVASFDSGSGGMILRTRQSGGASRTTPQAPRSALLTVPGANPELLEIAPPASVLPIIDAPPPGGGVILESSSRGENRGWYAFDGLQQSAWSPASNDLEPVLGVTVAAETTIGSYELAVPPGPVSAGPSGWQIALGTAVGVAQVRDQQTEQVDWPSRPARRYSLSESTTATYLEIRLDAPIVGTRPVEVASLRYFAPTVVRSLKSLSLAPSHVVADPFFEYWVEPLVIGESDGATIWRRSDLMPAGESVALGDGVGDVSGLAIDNGQLFWSNRRDGTIRSLELSL